MRTMSLNYRDTVELLQWKLITYIRLNQALDTNILYKTRFVSVTERVIMFNFIEFREAYKQKFIDPEFQSYCDRLNDFFRPVLLDFLKEIQYGGHTFHIVMKYKNDTWEKVFTVLTMSHDE